MIMVIGGSFQGKMNYAAQAFGLGEDLFADGKTSAEDDIFHAGGLYDFQDYVRRFLCGKSERELDDFAEKLSRRNPDLILVSDEVGYGIVPLDPEERRYREAVGRVCTDLCRRADRVDRVVCGIGTRIK